MAHEITMEDLISMVTNFRFEDDHQTATPETPARPARPARPPKSKPEGWIKHDSYEDIKELEHGSEAKTSLTKSTTTGKMYVVKRYFRFPVPEDNAAIQQCRRNPLPNEATVLLKALRSHPNVLRAFGCDRVGPRRCDLYTEFCDGGDLQNKIRECRRHNLVAAEHFTLHVFISLTEALAYLHHGLRWDSEKEQYLQEPGFTSFIHGDIKPENTFLRWSDKAERHGLPDVVLGDLGMSAPADHYVGICGTSGYAAPEVQMIWDLEEMDPEDRDPEAIKKVKHWHLTRATDIYSLGQTIHRLSTNKYHAIGADPGTTPVVASEEGMIGVRLGCDPAWYESKALTNVVQACLQANPVHRPEALENDLLEHVVLFKKELEKQVAMRQKARANQVARRQLEMKIKQLTKELLGMKLSDTDLPAMKQAATKKPTRQSM